MSGIACQYRFTKIDELTRGNHPYIGTDDGCYYLFEYHAGKGYQHSDKNQLIFNFKKEMTRKGKPDWHYKGQAIEQVARIFSHALAGRKIKGCVFVPIPPSIAKGDPKHDDRIKRMLNKVKPRLDVRELIIQKESTSPAHLSGGYRFPATYKRLYRIEKKLVLPPPRIIAVVDDIITTGAHYKATQSVLQRRFPGKRIFGLFIACSV